MIRRLLLRRLPVLAIAAASAAAIFIAADWPGSPLRRLLKSWDGCVLDVYQPRQQVVVSQPGEKALIAFPIQNVSDRDVTIYGIQSRCGCIRVEELPLKIAPGEMKNLHFEIHTEGFDPGVTVSRVSRLYVDVPSPILLLTVDIKVDVPHRELNGIGTSTRPVVYSSQQGLNSKE